MSGESLTVSVMVFSRGLFARETPSRRS